MNQPRCIAITGLDTFFGRRLLERLPKLLPDVKLVCLGSTPASRAAHNANVHQLDLSESGVGSRLAEIFEAEQVDTLVHLALKGVPGANVEHDFKLEVSGTREVLHACSESNVARFVIPSTTMCYGPCLENPQRLAEDAELRGHSGAHWVSNRVEIERAVAEFRAAHPTRDVTVLRHCWIMGPEFFDPVVRFLSDDWVPTLLGYDPLMQFVHEDDVLDVLTKAVVEPHSGVFNIVGEGVMPLSGYLRLAGKWNLPMPKRWVSFASGSPVPLASSDTADGFYDYLKYIWVASGDRASAEFGPLKYSSREAWVAMVGARRLRDYRARNLDADK